MVRHYSRTLALLPLLVPFALAYACGGDDSKKTTNPPPSGSDPSTTTSTTSSAMTSATASATEAVKPPEPAYVLPLAAAKYTPDKGAKMKAIEIKDDGTVNVGGKPYYKVSGGELDDATGKALLKVAKDGTVTQGDGKPFGKFDDKDMLNVEGGDTIAVGDDGKVAVTSGGKPVKDDAGKLDNSKSKRAFALVVGMERMMSALTAPKKEPPPKK